MGKRILIFSIIVVFLTSCSVLKKDKTTTTKETEKIEKSSDTISKESVNKAIDDKATIKIQESDTGDRDFDEAVNNAVTNILRSINFQKSSGDNSYRLYYDEKLKALQAEFQLGETRNKEVATNNEAVIEKTFEENISEYIKKIVIPWWVYLIPVYLFRKQILGVLYFVFPVLRTLTGLKSLKDVVTPPNK